MTTEATHHVSGTLGLAVVLAAGAGFVDAFVYVHVTPVFVANMSGNLVRLGISAGNGEWHGVAAAAIAIGGFLAGVFGATMRLDAQVRRGRTPSPVALLLVESVLLASIAGILIVRDVSFSPVIHGIVYLVVVLGALAMGCQAVALRRVGQIAVSTTYGTGSVVRLGEKLALAMRRSVRPGDQRRRITIAVLFTVLVSYVAGAGLASWAVASPELLFLPAAVPLLAALLLAARLARPD
jgi:uncharacterized membrane protein YoaK (UPF0700 family)